MIAVVEIFHHYFLQQTSATEIVGQSPQTIPSVTPAYTGTILPRPFKIEAEFRGIAETIAGIEIPRAERVAFVKTFAAAFVREEHIENIADMKSTVIATDNIAFVIID